MFSSRQELGGSWALLNLLTAPNTPYLLAGIASPEEHLSRRVFAHCQLPFEGAQSPFYLPCGMQAQQPLGSSAAQHIWISITPGSPGPARAPTLTVLKRSYIYPGMQEASGPLTASSKVC